VHDVLRGVLEEPPVGAGGSETCLAAGISAATTIDGDLPSGGQAFFYLVRARNVCGAGTYGNASDGTERVTMACP